MIYHIATKAEWEAAQESAAYTPARFARDGFIHASKREQVLPVAGRLFRGQAGLVLLEIDPERVGAEIKYEDLLGEGQEFPHIYGPLPLASVLAVWEFEPGPDGRFSFPS